MRYFWSSFVSILLCVIILVQLIEPVLSGRSRGGWGRVSSAGANASGAEAGSRRWGSSAPADSSQPNYKAAGNSVTRSAANRPAANAPIPSHGTIVQPVYNTNTTVINNSIAGDFFPGGFGTGSLLLSDAGGMVGGYLLGNMVARSLYSRNGCCYSCGCGYYGPRPPWYYDLYVPYRYRYQTMTAGTLRTSNFNIPKLNGTAAVSSSSTNTGSSANSIPTERPLFAGALFEQWLEMVRKGDTNVCKIFSYANIPECLSQPPVIAGETTAAPQASKPTDLCTLARWNMELPFTELPNMALTFLASDNISGEAIADKAEFFYLFLNNTVEPYGTLPATTNVYQIDPAYNLRTCNFGIPKLYGLAAESSGNNSTQTRSGAQSTTERPWFAGALSEQWRERVRKGDTHVCEMFSYANIPECLSQPSGQEEPIYTAVKRLTSLYTNASSDNTLLLEIVLSAKKCYPKDTAPPKQIIPCLDHSVGVAQVTSLENSTSVFGNEEVCRKFLNPNITSCIPQDSTFPCTAVDLTNLNVFVRNYYLCKDPVDPQLVSHLKAWH
ncbi:uncharacterized protein LOC129599938 [Paramacrobiotus metropolitanus]|uniref:uncharacterized protein LOC129599938 n=1 Tax=Paramacrobiotus metropolitanus TaxID=2943436 RepID=UPI0024464506|nr:uncharacterized protein LOC129599938 [Paramacrobiotus metropolitanus]